MRFIWIAAVPAALVAATTCVDLNQTVSVHMANRRVAEAERAVSAVSGPGAEARWQACAGLVLGNMAVYLSVSGRTADAERLAERSVLTLEKVYAADDAVLLRPLQVLAAARFEQGKTGRAREAFQRMQSVRIQRPEERALVHGMAAALLTREGRPKEAESEYLAAIRAWGEAGKGDAAEAGAIFNGLGSLLITEGRLTEAQWALDRALAIFDGSKDTVPSDRIKLLHVRGVLHAWQGRWREAEQDFHEAVAICDREDWGNPSALRSLLLEYAYTMRKNHHGREARPLEARAAALGRDTTVDVTELFRKPKAAKR